MSKVLLGLLLGALLGLIDGWGARFHDNVRPDEYVGIMGGSTFKGLLTGLAAGFAAKRMNSITAGVVTGVIVGFALSFTIGYMVEHGVGGETPKPGAFWPIVLPGTALGVVVGIAAQKFGRPQKALAY